MNITSDDTDQLCGQITAVTRQLTTLTGTDPSVHVGATVAIDEISSAARMTALAGVELVKLSGDPQRSKCYLAAAARCLGRAQEELTILGEVTQSDLAVVVAEQHLATLTDRCELLASKIAG